jgi:hypothetical protein
MLRLEPRRHCALGWSLVAFLVFRPRSEIPRYSPATSCRTGDSNSGRRLGPAHQHSMFSLSFTGVHQDDGKQLTE